MSSCSSCQKHQRHECGCHKKQGHHHDQDNSRRNSYFDHPWFHTTAFCSCQKKKFHNFCDRDY